MQEEYAILCVDDEVNILSSLKRLLRKEKIKLFTAENGADALEILKENKVELILTDFRMPGMNGIEFLEKTKNVSPDSIRVVLSGYADVDSVLKAINDGEVYRFITKPWEDKQLLITIQQCFEHYQLIDDNRQMNEDLIQLNLRLKDKILSDINQKTAAQSIIEALPEAFLVIDSIGAIELVNNFALSQYQAQFQLAKAKHIKKVFTEEVCEKIDLFMQSDAEHLEVDFDQGNNRFALLLYPTVKEGIRSGCVIRIIEVGH